MMIILLATLTSHVVHLSCLCRDRTDKVKKKKKKPPGVVLADYFGSTRKIVIYFGYFVRVIIPGHYSKYFLSQG